MTETYDWVSGLQNRHYSKAPIREAIIDIQLKPSGTVNLTDLEKLTKSVAGYPERRNILVGQITGQILSGQVTATAKNDAIGFQLIGGEGKHVAALRKDGFSFSRLAPYLTWQQFRDEAKVLWESYRRVIGEMSVTRIGVRYVNQLDLPAKLRDFRDYIRTYPEVSTDLPQLLDGFFMQVRIPQADIEAVSIINEAIVPPAGPDLVSVVLDIDVFREGLNMVKDEDTWKTLEVLRVRKNLLFEGCITNNTRKLIS